MRRLNDGGPRREPQARSPGPADDFGAEPHPQPDVDPTACVNDSCERCQRWLRTNAAHLAPGLTVDPFDGVFVLDEDAEAVGEDALGS